jgi:hypothetical protein
MDLGITFVNVYMHVTYKDKVECWRFLTNIKSTMNVSSSIIIGDFSIVLNSNDKRGGNLVRDPLRENMEYFIYEWDLMDIKPEKGKYKWSNKRT